MGNDWEWDNNYTEKLEAYNDEIRRIARAEERGILRYDDRTQLQRKLDSMSLAEAWDYCVESNLQRDAESSHNLKKTRVAAQKLLKSKAYKENNPYKNGGYEVFLGNYVLSERGILSRFDGWYTDRTPNFEPFDYFKRMSEEEALKAARKDGAKLFRKEGSSYTRIE